MPIAEPDRTKGAIFKGLGGRRVSMSLLEELGCGMHSGTSSESMLDLFYCVCQFA